MLRQTRTVLVQRASQFALGGALTNAEFEASFELVCAVYRRIQAYLWDHRETVAHQSLTQDHPPALSLRIAATPRGSCQDPSWYTSAMFEQSLSTLESTDENDWCRHIFRESNKAADTHANWLMDNGDSGPGAQWMAPDLHDKMQKSRHIVLSFDLARRRSGLGAAAWIQWLRDEYGTFQKVSCGGRVLRNASAMIAECEALRMGIEHLTVLFPTVVSSFDFQVECTDRTVQSKLNAQSLRLFGLHRNVNDAHRAGANRLQNKQQTLIHINTFSSLIFLRFFVSISFYFLDFLNFTLFLSRICIFTYFLFSFIFVIFSFFLVGQRRGGVGKPKPQTSF